MQDGIYISKKIIYIVSAVILILIIAVGVLSWKNLSSKKTETTSTSKQAIIDSLKSNSENIEVIGAEQRENVLNALRAN